MQLAKATGATAEERLRSLGLELPPPPVALAHYEQTVIVNSILYMSGQLPSVDGELRYKGKIGSALSTDDGYRATQLAALNAIAQINAALGSLERVKRVFRLEGVMNVAPGFAEMPQVLNGASHLVSEVFAERGRHTRMIYTNPEIAFDCPCLIVLWTEIET
jgi:enamine deaminase RidA (YjgF/YER057c/UK114 family)